MLNDDNPRCPNRCVARVKWEGIRGGTEPGTREYRSWDYWRCTGCTQEFRTQRGSHNDQ